VLDGSSEVLRVVDMATNLLQLALWAITLVV